MKIQKSNGLQISEKVYKLFSEGIKNIDSSIDIFVDTFNNCRETGYCYQIFAKNKVITIWTCECRNSDDIMSVISFEVDCKNINNLYNDNAYIKGREYYKHSEYEVLANKLIRLVEDLVNGEYDNNNN